MACGICGSAGHNRRTHAEHDEPQSEALIADQLAATRGLAHGGFLRSQLEREARASIELDRDQTHVLEGPFTVGGPVSVEAPYDPAGLDQFMAGRISSEQSEVPVISSGVSATPDENPQLSPKNFHFVGEQGPEPVQVGGEDAPTVMGPTGVIYVCATCGTPVESEPCERHQPKAWTGAVGREFAEHFAAVDRAIDEHMTPERMAANLSAILASEPHPVPPWRTVLGPDEPIRITQPGVYVLEAHEYHDPTITGDWLSNSDARQLTGDGCPAQFRYDRDNGVRKTSPAFSVGHAYHALVLGKGETIAVRPAFNPDDPDDEWDSWRKNSAKKWRAEQEAAARSVILPEDAEIVEAMAAAVHEHERAHELLSQPGRPEVALFWVDPATGVRRRALVDYLPERPDANGVMRVVDLKSADEVAPNDKMERKLYDHCWHRQATTIADGVVALGLAAEVDFHFIVQLKKAPHLVTVVRLDSDAERIGGIENRRAIDVYKRCVETDTWPSFADDTVTMTVPGWIANRYQDELEVI